MTELYCIYCGQDQSEGHSVECPLVAGIPKAAFGIYPRPGDVEYNLSLGRMSILWKIDLRKGEFVMPEDPKVWDRLVYEDTAFNIRRSIQKHIEYESEKTKLSDGWLSRRRKRKLDQKLKEEEKKIEKAREFFKEVLDLNKAPLGSKLSMKSFDQILQTEKVRVTWNVQPDVRGKSSVSYLHTAPVFRNSETLELIYAKVEG
jgi:hypothetical protein